MPIVFFFSFFCISLALTGIIMSLKWSFLGKPLSTFAILPGLWSAGFKYLTGLNLKHLLSPIFWNQSINFSTTAEELNFERLISWSMTKSIIQPEHFPKTFCRFDIIAV